MKINLLFNNQTKPVVSCGMDLYRLAFPYTPLKETNEVLCLSHDHFDMNPLDGDVYVMNRPRKFRAKKVKDAGKILIVDIDDYWEVPKWHNLHVDILKNQLDFAAKNPTRVNQDEVNAVRRAYNIEKTQANDTLESARMADIVTCTTPTLQAELAKIGIKSIIVKNTIHPDSPMFTDYKTKSNRTRFAWIGGSFHRRDVALMYDGLRRLHGDAAEKGKYQIQMSFNVNQDYIEQEKMVTNNYSICSPEYRDFLKAYVREGGHIGNDETYKRLWNMGVMEYGAIYQGADVALIPLQEGKFNSCKSELKLIEAGMTGCAAIVSDVLPYKPYLKHGVNCLTTEGTNGWYTAMKILINNPDRRQELAYNLKKTIAENFDVYKESHILATELNKLK